jgi:hypothetical protein
MGPCDSSTNNRSAPWAILWRNAPREVASSPASIHSAWDSARCQESLAPAKVKQVQVLTRRAVSRHKLTGALPTPNDASEFPLRTSLVLPLFARPTVVYFETIQGHTYEHPLDRAECDNWRRVLAKTDERRMIVSIHGATSTAVGTSRDWGV